MKKQIFILGFLVFAFSFLLNYSGIINFAPSPDNSRVDQQDQVKAKKDSPELFAQFQHDIRTRNGETNPSYESNYKIKELLKARGVNTVKELSRLKNRDGLDWIERGPGNISGRTRGIIADPDDPSVNTWYVGSVGGGVWKTTDAGNSWTNLTPFVSNLATSTIAMAASNHDVIYFGTGEGFYNVDQIDGMGIWKTTDRGLTWEQLQSTTDPDQWKNIMRILVDPNDENVVIAASGLGFNGGASSAHIYRSTDGGATWTSVYNSGSNNVEQLVADPTNFNILYGTVDGAGVIKSTNAGLSWFSSANGMGNVARTEMTVSPVDPNRLYASSQGGSVGSTFYYSTDAGANWTGVDPQYSWLGAQGWYDNTIAAHPYNVDACFVGGINIWRIDLLPNGTIDLQVITDGYGQYGGSSKGVHVDQHNLVLVPTNVANQEYRLINGNDGGVSYSDDEGLTFTQPKNGYNTTQFYGVDKKNGADEYVGGMQDNSSWRSPSGVSADSTSNWIFQWGGDGYEAAWHYTNPNKILVSSQYNRVGISVDGGLNYSNAVSDIPDVGSGNAPFFTKIAKSKQDPDLIFLMGASGVWRSANFTQNWRLIKLQGGSYGGTSTFSQVKISLADPQVVWAGSNVDPSIGLFVSNNGGLNFNISGGYPTVDMGRITGLATHPTDPNTAYATFSFADAPKVLRTTDLGTTWEDISGFGTGNESSTGFPDVAVFHFLVMPFDTDIFWAGTEIGIFESTDAGGSWHFLEGDFPAAAVYDMSIVNDQVVVATHGRGIWTVTLPELAGYEPPDVLLAPVLNEISFNENGLNYNLNLREVYDSTHLLLDGNNVMTIMNSTPTEDVFTVPFTPPESRAYELSAVSFDGARMLYTEVFSMELFSTANPQPSYSTDFSVDDSVFIGEDFSIKREFGFSNPAIHSRHPYLDQKTITYTLTIPIKVAAADAFLKYEDVAIVEPGEPGSHFGETQFYDYVVVEGSPDGGSWTPLANGYDATLYPEWLNAYENGGMLSGLYKQHEINLLDTFNAGDSILIRFRLFADELVNAWGWSIDNLEVQEELTAVENSGEMPGEFYLAQNYPNPFNPSTTIKFSIPYSSKVKLIVFDALGREVETLVDKKMKNGVYEINWNASHLASGVYFYSIKTDKNSAVKKLLLLK